MLRWCWLSLGLLLAAPAPAAMVSLEVSPGLVARAHYEAGGPGQPAVVLLHGFLQTYQFPTIHQLAESLHSTGITVLTPNLSLNITHRQQSLACEALHTHTLRQDIQELAQWVGWLKQRHAGPIVLGGHSLGSLIALAYLDDQPDSAIQRFIGISIMEGRLPSEAGNLHERIAQLRTQAQQPKPALLVQPFSFCQHYRSTPASLLSYLEWTPERILNAIRSASVPVTFIMGDHDDRLGPDWIAQLQASPAKTVLIAGANHFMDGEKEFDLLDAVLTELEALRAHQP